MKDMHVGERSGAAPNLARRPAPPRAHHRRSLVTNAGAVDTHRAAPRVLDVPDRALDRQERRSWGGRTAVRAAAPGSAPGAKVKFFASLFGARTDGR